LLSRWPLPPRPWPLPAGSSGNSLVVRCRRPGGLRWRVVSVSAVFTLVIFSSPSERSRLGRNSSQPPKRSEFLLSWDSPALHPSAVRPPMRPLPEAHAPFGPTVRPIESCSALGVSHPLGGLLRIGVAGLLHPAAGYGVRRVSRCPSHPLEGGGYERCRSPRRGTPYEEFPSSAAVPHRCGRCLLDVSVRPPGLTRPVARAFEERREQVRWRPSPRGPACAVPRGPSSFRRRGAGVDPRRP
jgi:hypothetical protein